MNFRHAQSRPAHEETIEQASGARFQGGLPEPQRHLRLLLPRLGRSPAPAERSRDQLDHRHQGPGLAGTDATSAAIRAWFKNVLEQIGQDWRFLPVHKARSTPPDQFEQMLSDLRELWDTAAG